MKYLLILQITFSAYANDTATLEEARAKDTKISMAISNTYVCLLSHRGEPVCWERKSGKRFQFPADSQSKAFTLLSPGDAHICWTERFGDRDSSLRCAGSIGEVVGPGRGGYNNRFPEWISSEGKLACALWGDWSKELTCWGEGVEKHPALVQRAMLAKKLSALEQNTYRNIPYGTDAKNLLLQNAKSIRLGDKTLIVRKAVQTDQGKVEFRENVYPTGLYEDSLSRRRLQATYRVWKEYSAG